MRAVSCVWGPAAESHAERIGRYCAAAGWELVEEAVKAGIQDGALGWIFCATRRTGAERLLLAAENVAELERDLPRLWPRVRALLEDAGVAVLTVPGAMGSGARAGAAGRVSAMTELEPTP